MVSTLNFGSGRTRIETVNSKPETSMAYTGPTKEYLPGKNEYFGYVTNSRMADYTVPFETFLVQVETDILTFAYNMYQ